jgi:uncharacterized protein (TIGR00290 family)
MTQVFVSWSSGKDSAFALYEARRMGLEPVGVLTTINDVHDRVAMHGVRNALLDRQTRMLGLPAIKVSIPAPCPNEVYEARMADACARIRAAGVRHIVFGDLFLEDIRAYRIEKLSAAGIEPIFPLWKRDTALLAREMIASGLVAHITCLDPRKMPRSLAGRRFDETLLRELPPGVDPCGENGEFHTVVTDGPMFAGPIPITIGETLERDGFVFTDVLLADTIPSDPPAIRRFTPEDADGIWSILEPVFRAGETYAIARDVSKEDALQYWCAADHESFVALDSGRIVGTYFIRANHGGGGDHVANCGYATAPAARGRGIARAMLRHSIARAKERGFTAMQFNLVVSTNTGAVRLWQGDGFEIVGRLPGAFRHPSQGYVDALVMYRRL